MWGMDTHSPSHAHYMSTILMILILGGAMRICDAVQYNAMQCDAMWPRRDQVKKARLLANPGCYPTCSQLPLYPLLKSKLISTEDIIINACSGATRDPLPKRGRGGHVGAGVHVRLHARVRNVHNKQTSLQQYYDCKRCSANQGMCVIAGGMHAWVGLRPAPLACRHSPRSYSHAATLPAPCPT